MIDLCWQDDGMKEIFEREQNLWCPIVISLYYFAFLQVMFHGSPYSMCHAIFMYYSTKHYHYLEDNLSRFGNLDIAKHIIEFM